jgi:hypothetical protein
MPGIARERGILPLLAHDAQDAGDGGSAGALATPSLRTSVLGHRRLAEAARALDGIGGLGWSVIGFVVGAVFWHFIGFWGFMAEVVLAGGPPTSIERAAWSAPRTGIAGAQSATPTSEAHVSCTTLALDRRSGTTSARPCSHLRTPLRADDFQGREDRVAAVRADPRR